ncbi:hypothetical protein DERF_007364 [Dermatophagoides farinae]|uniref:Uncharacterized protein n=1 Tax=Dermatophagoides farinae TaxID=6954 RepID=A0A922HZ89_DERFA|nr:hypothetical protein DERF_007364 [Dermatophagoides farinae]
MPIDKVSSNEYPDCEQSTDSTVRILRAMPLHYYYLDFEIHQILYNYDQKIYLIYNNACIIISSPDCYYLVMFIFICQFFSDKLSKFRYFSIGQMKKIICISNWINGKGIAKGVLHNLTIEDTQRKCII